MEVINRTHVRNLHPGSEDRNIYHNRKTYFSINVQAVRSPDLKIFDIVARWPYSSHDATIFNNSRLGARFANQ